MAGGAVEETAAVGGGAPQAREREEAPFPLPSTCPPTPISQQCLPRPNPTRDSCQGKLGTGVGRAGLCATKCSTSGSDQKKVNDTTGHSHTPTWPPMPPDPAQLQSAPNPPLLRGPGLLVRGLASISLALAPAHPRVGAGRPRQTLPAPETSWQLSGPLSQLGTNSGNPFCPKLPTGFISNKSFLFPNENSQALS